MLQLLQRRLSMSANETKLAGFQPQPLDQISSGRVLSIRHVPEDLYRAVRVAAATSGLGVQQYVMAALAGQAPLPLVAEMTTK